jgi:hypothetical protein
VHQRKTVAERRIADGWPAGPAFGGGSRCAVSAHDQYGARLDENPGPGAADHRRSVRADPGAGRADREREAGGGRGGCGSGPLGRGRPFLRVGRTATRRREHSAVPGCRVWRTGLLPSRFARSSRWQRFQDTYRRRARKYFSAWIKPTCMKATVSTRRSQWDRVCRRLPKSIMGSARLARYGTG